MLYFDPIYFLFIAPGLIVGVIATVLLRIWGSEYKSIQNVSHLTGSEIVAKVSRSNRLDINMRIVPGDYNDSYDPTDSTITLSNNTAYSTTITSSAITAHELGHAIQHKNGGLLFSFRNFLIPIVNIGTNLGYFLIILGFAVNFLDLSEIGIILFSISTVFTLLTLPIEFDASSKALKLLINEGILYPDEIKGAKKVLAGAALTYVAALFESIGQILYFIFRVRRKD